MIALITEDMPKLWYLKGVNGNNGEKRIQIKNAGAFKSSLRLSFSFSS